METTLLSLGIACIIAAIVGGGFKGLGVEIPVIATKRRQAILALAGAVLILVQQYAQWRTDHPPLDASVLLRSGLESYDGGDLGVAARHLKQAAELGNAEAQYHYGEMLYHGEGLIPDKEQAATWILKSAEQGFPPAQASLAGLALEQSPPDSVAARLWAERSANQNDPRGLGLLAGLEQDWKNRWDPLLRSAEGGYATSQLLLGLKMLDSARSLGGRLGRALGGADWIRRAANQGDESAQLMMARLAQGFARSDTTMYATAYVWWTLAQRPHKAHFAAAPEVRESAAHVGDSIEAHLLLSKQLEARKIATESEEWQPKVERPYRHGH